jgi:hypothetical protein
MGYDPFDIVHLKRAHEEGLGDAGVVFDPASLPYRHPKDGGWAKPDPEVSKFYENMIESFLLLPGMQNFFDLAANFVLYGTATMPFLMDLTPEFEGVLDDVLSVILRSGIRGSDWGAGDLERFMGLIRHGARRSMAK